MRVLVIGASSGTGREATTALLSRGHRVTAFARSADRLPEVAGLTRHKGDALIPADLDAAMPGHDAVVVALGIHESPLLVRLGFGKTPIDVRSVGTTNTIAAMKRHGVRRLVVQTTYGIGDSKGRLPLAWALIFWLLLKPQIADSEKQEAIVRASDLDWTLVQPVGLTDVDKGTPVLASPLGETRGMEISRAQVARFLGEVVEQARPGACLALST